jgi:hypothetical protein
VEESIINRCVICSGHVLRWSETPELKIGKCAACNHRVAIHKNLKKSAEYHEQYEEEKLIAALEGLRRQQASHIFRFLGGKIGKIESVIDYGSGRGWFLSECANRGIKGLIGVDGSPLAVESAKKCGALGVQDDLENPTAILKADIDFSPQIAVLLDVVEHFAITDLPQKINTLIEPFRAKLSVVIVKVPTSNGLFFNLALLLSLLGWDAPLHQLFQVGSYPPHFHYFSVHSLKIFAANCNLEILSVERELDFLPGTLRDRIDVLKKFPRFVGTGIGWFMKYLAILINRYEAAILYGKVSH